MSNLFYIFKRNFFRMFCAHKSFFKIPEKIAEDKWGIAYKYHCLKCSYYKIEFSPSQEFKRLMRI